MVLLYKLLTFIFLNLSLVIITEKWDNFYREYFRIHRVSKDFKLNNM